ncbi:synaptojanin-like protein, putative, partial [Bodo saltans]
MRGKLVGVGGAGDPLISPHAAGGALGSSPVATPRSTALPVGLYYFLVLHGNSQNVSDIQKNGVSQKSASSSSAASSVRPHQHHHHGGMSSSLERQASLPTSLRATDPLSDNPLLSVNDAGVTFLVAIDNVTGQLLFTGTPKVDIFASEAAALFAIPSKVSLAPEGVRVTTICHFDAWCGCYASDEFLHCMFVTESSGVRYHNISGGVTSTSGGRAHSSPASSPPPFPAARSATTEWTAAEDDDVGGYHNSNHASSSPIKRIDRIVWKSIRLQCPQHVLTHHAIPNNASSSQHHQQQQHAKPPSHRLDDTRRSMGDLSNHSTDGATGDQRPPEFPMDHNAVIFSSSEQVLMTPYFNNTTGVGIPPLERKAMYYSSSFDISHGESTRLFFSDLNSKQRRTTACNGNIENKQQRAMPSMASPASNRKYFLPSNVILKPEFRLIHTEHLWNVELIHYCEASQSGLGDFCTRIMYGVVQGASTLAAAGLSRRTSGVLGKSPSQKNTPTAPQYQQDSLGSSPSGGGGAGTTATTPEAASMVLISRVSRVAYRQSLVEFHRNPIRSNTTSSSLAGTGGVHSQQNETKDHNARHGTHVHSGGNYPHKPPLEIHIAMECELQLILCGMLNTPSPSCEGTPQASPNTSKTRRIDDEPINAGESKKGFTARGSKRREGSSFNSFVWFRGISHIAGVSEHQNAPSDRDALQKQVALRQARERRHRSALQDCVLPTSGGKGISTAGSPVTASHNGSAPQSRAFVLPPPMGGTFTPSLSPLTSPSPNLNKGSHLSNNNNASFWDAQIRHLSSEADVLQRGATGEQLASGDHFRGAHYKLRRCGLTEEKQLGAALLTMFTWAVEALAAASPNMLSSELHVQSPIPSHSSLLGMLWLLMFRESSVQYSVPEQQGTGCYSTFAEALGFVRRVCSIHQSSCHSSSHGLQPPHRWLPFDDNAIVHSLLTASAMLQLSEVTGAPTLDHRYAGFLQLLVEVPRSTRLRIGSHRPIVILSDPCGGATLVKASVTVHTAASAQG